MKFYLWIEQLYHCRGFQKVQFTYISVSGHHGMNGVTYPCILITSAIYFYFFSGSQVPIGGCYRLIDVPMSNCINSGINKIFVLTQFNSQSLNRHLARTYNCGNGVNFGDGFVEVRCCYFFGHPNPREKGITLLVFWLTTVKSNPRRGYKHVCMN